MLTRWAHFSLTSSTLDRIGTSGTFNYGRLQYEIENSLKRYERLCEKDGYEDIRDGKRKRPQTKDINDLDKEGNLKARLQDKEDELEI